MDLRVHSYNGTIEEEVMLINHHDLKILPSRQSLQGGQGTLWVASITKSMVTQKENEIFISQDKYVAKILKKFNYTDVEVLLSTTSIDLEKPLVKDGMLIMHVKRGQDTKIPQSNSPPVKVGDEAVHKELGDRMERAATTASSLEAEQDNINRTQSKETLNDPNSLGTGSGSGPRTLISIHSLMAPLKFCDTHNMVAYLQKIEGSDSFHQIIDFLTTSHIKYALTENPIIYVSLIHQFWESASASTPVNGEMEIISTIDGKVKIVNEASIRRHLKLEDGDGISSLPNTEIFKQLALMGYVSDYDKLIFQKGHFFPQWKFLIHTILHCLSPKKTSWEQFSSNIATTIICLTTNRTFNFSMMIFEGVGKGLIINMVTELSLIKRRRVTRRKKQKDSMVESSKNEKERKKTSDEQQERKQHVIAYSKQAAREERMTVAGKNSRQESIKITGVNVGFNLDGSRISGYGQGEGSTVPLSLNPDTYRAPSPPLNTNYTNILCKTHMMPEEPATTPHDSSHQAIKLHYGAAYTKLIMRVKKLEHKVKSSQPRRRARVVISDTEKDLENPSKQGRKIAEIDKKSLYFIDQKEPTRTSVKIFTKLSILSTADVFEDEMMTIAESLVAIRRTIPRTTSVVIHDPKEEPRRTVPEPTSPSHSSYKDKGKEKMIELDEPVKIKRRDQSCNKDQLEDFEEFNGGSVTFGGSKGYISDKPNVKGVGYRWMFDIDYLTDSMNYIPVSLENQANQHAGTSEVTNNAGTSQTTNSNASEEKDEEVELIVVPSAVKITEEKVESRTSSTNLKKEETLTEPQKEKKDSSTDTLEDNPKIQAFRRELEEIALKHLGTVPENNSTSTPSVNTGSQTINTGMLDLDDLPMPELEIFHKSETGIFDEASYDEEGVINDFNNLPTEIEVSPTPTLRIHNIHPKSQILGDPKSDVQTRMLIEVRRLGGNDEGIWAAMEDLLSSYQRLKYRRRAFSGAVFYGNVVIRLTRLFSARGLEIVGSTQTGKKVDRVPYEIIPQIAERAKDNLIENNLKPCIVETSVEDRDAFRSEVPDFISKEFNSHPPQIIEELFKQYVQNNMKRSLQDRANVIALSEVLKRKFEKSSTSNTSCRDDASHSQHYDDHQVDDAPPPLPEGEKRVNKRVPTIFNRARMEATLNDMLSNQFNNAEEYAYHLEQATNFMENQIVWESIQEDIRRPIPIPLIFFGPQRNLNEPPMYLYNKDRFFLKNGNTDEKKYILCLHKINAERFPEADLEEKMNR
ncbi:hypothetical protein Tco_0140766 [Tanacetum coccineum]